MLEYINHTGAKNVPYRLINEAAALVDCHALGVKSVMFVNRMNGRAVWNNSERIVVMNPFAKCFQPNYKGYAYKKFGGQKDLTPGGVFLHECGHALTFRHPDVLKDFRKLRGHGYPKSISAYGTNYLKEDVAECFRLYVSNEELLARIVPERFEVIDKYARKYKIAKQVVQ